MGTRLQKLTSLFSAKEKGQVQTHGSGCVQIMKAKSNDNYVIIIADEGKLKNSIVLGQKEINDLKKAIKKI